MIPPRSRRASRDVYVALATLAVLLIVSTGIVYLIFLYVGS